MTLRVLRFLAVAGSLALGGPALAQTPAAAPGAAAVPQRLDAAPPPEARPGSDAPAGMDVETRPSTAAPPSGTGPGAAPSPVPDPVDAALPHDLSPWGMFLAADRIVKGVMLGLAFASVVTWTVWLAKSSELAASTLRLRHAAADLAGAASLAAAAETLGARRGPAAEMVHSSAAEIGLSDGAGAGLKERVASRLERIEVAAGRRMMRGTGVLATIGSTAPFVGLFGTVWGIMNAFVGISKAQTTNLAVVAPGIAEALLATAIGLVAAIPAVIIYNLFARSITGYRVLLRDVSAEIARIVSRDVDRMQAARRGAAA